jgi:hypothetical protein
MGENSEDIANSWINKGWEAGCDHSGGGRSGKRIAGLTARACRKFSFIAPRSSPEATLNKGRFHEGTFSMLRRLVQTRFFSKVFFELLPAAIVSVLGTFLINKYARPADPPPQPAASSEANAELVRLLREQQVMLAGYLKKAAETQQRTGLASEHETETLKAAERGATRALREAKAAEARSVAAARAGTEAPERKPARQQPQPSEKPLAERPANGEPLQLHPAAGAAPVPAPAPAPAMQPPSQAATPAPSGLPRDNAAVSALRDAVSVIERIPSRIGDWFTIGAPPRPPEDLPKRNFMNVAM